MIKVANVSENGVTLSGWRILPRSSCVISPDGTRTDKIPAYLADCEPAKLLERLGVLRFYRSGQKR